MDPDTVRVLNECICADDNGSCLYIVSDRSEVKKRYKFMKGNREAVRYKKNDMVKLEITDMTTEGMGVGKIDGYALFVKDAVIGDLIEARIVKVKRSYGYGRVERILRESEKRVTPGCPIARSCGGCQLQAMNYEAQLDLKKNKVRNALIRIGGFDAEFIDSVMDPVIGMDEPWRYRNKSQYPIGTDKDGNTVAGFYAGRTHSIIPCTDCALAPEENSTILRTVLEHMHKHGIAPYDETDGIGTVRHVMVRKGFNTGEIMVCIVVKQENNETGGRFSVSFPFQNELIEKLREIPGMKSICISINNEDTNVIMGNEIHTLYGNGRINDILLGKVFKISPLSFYQVNPVQVEKLYGTAIEYASLTGCEEVWDICCGIGTISLCMSDNARIVHGLEIVPEAIEDAKRNALLNSVDNAEFICAAAEEYLPLHKDEIRADVVVLDPPRKGMDEAALAAVVDIAPDRIVYVSCDPATLARDLKYLICHGYELKRVRCIDMFCQTVHVETVVCLSKGDVKSKKIRVEFSLEDIDTDGFKKGATYNAIRDWIKAKYGYRVTNLNIAQVKQKHGIIERENYNKPKSPDSKQPGCPEEKVKAIEDAMRHFQMI